MYELTLVVLVLSCQSVALGLRRITFQSMNITNIQSHLRLCFKYYGAIFKRLRGCMRGQIDMIQIKGRCINSVLVTGPRHIRVLETQCISPTSYSSSCNLPQLSKIQGPLTSFQNILRKDVSNRP